MGLRFRLCYDLLTEDACRSDDLETCRAAVVRASGYVPAARAEMPQRFREYAPSIRFYERGIALAMDDGELEKALSLCDEAIVLGLAKVYAAKRASIERMWPPATPGVLDRFNLCATNLMSFVLDESVGLD